MPGTGTGAGTALPAPGFDRKLSIHLGPTLVGAPFRPGNRREISVAVITTEFLAFQCQRCVKCQRKSAQLLHLFL